MDRHLFLSFFMFFIERKPYCVSFFPPFHTYRQMIERKKRCEYVFFRQDGATHRSDRSIDFDKTEQPTDHSTRRSNPRRSNPQIRSIDRYRRSNPQIRSIERYDTFTNQQNDVHPLEEHSTNPLDRPTGCFVCVCVCVFSFLLETPQQNK